MRRGPVHERLGKPVEIYRVDHPPGHSTAKYAGRSGKARASSSSNLMAVSTFNTNAYKASVAMARRALQQALEDKGVTKGSKLLDQINELEGKGLLSKPTSYFAHAARAFGNYSVHPNDDLLAQTTRDDAEAALMVARNILKEFYK